MIKMAKSASKVEKLNKLVYQCIDNSKCFPKGPENVTKI